MQRIVSRVLGVLFQRNILVLIFVGIVERSEGGNVVAVESGDELTSEVVFLGCRGIIPHVFVFRRRAADEEVGILGDFARVVTEAVLAGILITGHVVHADVLIHHRVGSDKVKRAAQCFIRARADVGCTLTHFNGFQIEHVDKFVRFTAASVA